MFKSIKQHKSTTIMQCYQLIKVSTVPIYIYIYIHSNSTPLMSMLCPASLFRVVNFITSVLDLFGLKSYLKFCYTTYPRASFLHATTYTSSEYPNKYFMQSIGCCALIHGFGCIHYFSQNRAEQQANRMRYSFNFDLCS